MVVDWDIFWILKKNNSKFLREPSSVYIHIYNNINITFKNTNYFDIRVVFVKIWLNNVYYINYSPIYLFLKLWPLLLGGSSSPSASSSISMTFKASLRRLSELLHLYLCCRYCPSNVDEALKVGLFEQYFSTHPNRDRITMTNADTEIS